MVIAADDVGDAHVVVVGHNCQIIRRISVGAQQHQIIEVLGAPSNRALDGVSDLDALLHRAAKAYDVGLVRVAFGRVTVAPG